MPPHAPSDVHSDVCVASTDPQASAVWWSRRVEKTGGLPFHFVQLDDPTELAGLRETYRHIFVDTPGSLEDEARLLVALEQADDVIVPMMPEALCFDPTARTIGVVLEPRGLPYRVVVNNWDPRDGKTDLQQTAQYIAGKGWPMCNAVIRRYKLHARASAEGLVVTQYPGNRTADQARLDFFRLALELGYGGRDDDGPGQVHCVANQKGGVGKTTVAVNLAAVTHDVLAPDSTWHPGAMTAVV